MTEVVSNTCEGCDLSFQDICLLFENDDIENFTVLCVAHNIMPEVITCPRVNCESIVSIDYTRGLYRCRSLNEKFEINLPKKARCSYTRSVFVDTIFHRAKPNPIKVMQLFRAFAYRNEDFTQSCMKHNFHPISDNLISCWRNVYHEVLISYMERDLEVNGKFGGPDVVVEISEICLKENALLNKNSVDLIFGGIDTKNKRIFLLQWPVVRDTEKMLFTIQRFIHPGSKIVSDCWNSYRCPSFSNFERFVQNNKLELINAESDNDIMEIRNILQKVLNYLEDDLTLKTKSRLASFFFNYNIIDNGERFHRFLLECGVYCKNNLSMICKYSE